MSTATISPKSWLNFSERLSGINVDFQTKKHTLGFKWTLKVLDEYAKVVSEAMGSVSARGGYVRMSFLTTKGNEYWKNLTPYTLATKYQNRKENFTGPLGKREDIYDRFAWQFSIWRDTGETQDAVQVYKDGFAGIPSSRSKVFKRAERTELGDPADNIPPRRLFAVANQMFIDAIREAFGADGHNDNPFANELRAEFVDFMKKEYKWRTA